MKILKLKNTYFLIQRYLSFIKGNKTLISRVDLISKILNLSKSCFYRFVKLKFVFRCKGTKSGSLIGFLRMDQKKLQKKYFIKNLSSPTVFKQLFYNLFSLILTK